MRLMAKKDAPKKLNAERPSENYVCPFVPLENWLKVPVHAGEKNYQGET